MKVTNLKASTLSRPVSTDPHSISQRPSRLLNNTWASAAPWSVTHVNRHYVIILTDGDSTVTYNTPTRPETSVNLKIKWVGNAFFIHNGSYLITRSKCEMSSPTPVRGGGGGARRRMTFQTITHSPFFEHFTYIVYSQIRLYGEKPRRVTLPSQKAVTRLGGSPCLPSQLFVTHVNDLPRSVRKCMKTLLS